MPPRLTSVAWNTDGFDFAWHVEQSQRHSFIPSFGYPVSSKHAANTTVINRTTPEQWAQVNEVIFKVGNSIPQAFASIPIPGALAQRTGGITKIADVWGGMNFWIDEAERMGTSAHMQRFRELCPHVNRITIADNNEGDFGPMVAGATITTKESNREPVRSWRPYEEIQRTVSLTMAEVSREHSIEAAETLWHEAEKRLYGAYFDELRRHFTCPIVTTGYSVDARTPETEIYNGWGPSLYRGFDFAKVLAATGEIRTLYVRPKVGMSPDQFAWNCIKAAWWAHGGAEVRLVFYADSKTKPSDPFDGWTYDDYFQRMADAVDFVAEEYAQSEVLLKRPSLTVAEIDRQLLLIRNDVYEWLE